MGTNQLSCMIALFELLEKHKPGPAAAAAAEAFAGVAMAEMAAEADAAAPTDPAATADPAAAADPAATATEAARQKMEAGAALVKHLEDELEFFSLPECYREDIETSMMVAEDLPYLMFLANGLRNPSGWLLWALRADTRSMLEELD